MTPARSDPPRWAWSVAGAAAGLAGIGAVTMVSAVSQVNPDLATRHAIWIGLGVAAAALLGRTNYRGWSQGAAAIYGLSVCALLMVPVAGAMRLGATRWLSVFGFSIQPAELAKVATVLVLAQDLSAQPSPLPPRALARSALIAGIPAALIFLQPDLGSASVLAAIWLGLVAVAGLSRRTWIRLGVTLVVAAPIGWHLLKDYQRDRLLVFLNPQWDPLGAGYTIIQSIIAIGSGGLRGRGWFAGTQNQLSFLPERHSDFIFSVIGEEWGWLGCVLVVGLFGVLLRGIARVAASTTDPHGRLLAAGIFIWLAYQACVNLGMVMGLLPVVGVPLPLMSYGGSSMVGVWAAVGVLQSIRRAAAAE